MQEGHQRELDKLRKRADDLQAEHNLLTDELTTLRKDKAVLELEVAQLMKRVRLRPYARPAPCCRFDAESRRFVLPCSLTVQLLAEEERAQTAETRAKELSDDVLARTSEAAKVC